ncbi:hypothetical protein H5119_13340 [Pseudoalteromonas sp. SG45-5]|uniref:hypothetical protein n=1 Tax=unclassified Pseudoalteromonas TaxID=194690 RepID=UPI0015FCE792|nr:MULTISPECIES: hypothetical protein [unclassified Pseudoalteromonas]MBB1386511.1 hypothetical protein [Pseudoalteromonas sp. SG45-5]MBB1394568.1 hypothetical protein [Pseudoalteromonas sp. SG44-4]MBB1448649.1 hypothetical protein [Pseudoalteromonas sp. SG41-6]
MTSITFANQYGNYNSSSITKAASPSEVAAIYGPTSEKASDVNGMNATPKEQTFLERAQEAIVYQRLGINKEKIDKLKEAIEDLSKELQGQGADLDIINDKINELEKMLEQEYKQGRDRMDMQPQHERGKIISALV